MRVNNNRVCDPRTQQLIVSIFPASAAFELAPISSIDLQAPAAAWTQAADANKGLITVLNFRKIRVVLLAKPFSLYECRALDNGTLREFET